MTVAADRIAELTAWLAKSSSSPSKRMGEGTLIGPYAVMVPCDFAEPPEPAFDENALPLFIDARQAVGLSLPPIVTEPPASQDRAAERLGHIRWLIEGGTLPRCAIVPLTDPEEPISAAVERAGADGLDVTTFPVLCVQMWAFSVAHRAALRLPLLPR